MTKNCHVFLSRFNFALFYIFIKLSVLLTLVRIAKKYLWNKREMIMTCLIINERTKLFFMHHPYQSINAYHDWQKWHSVNPHDPGSSNELEEAHEDWGALMSRILPVRHILVTISLWQMYRDQLIPFKTNGLTEETVLDSRRVLNRRS